MQGFRDPLSEKLDPAGGAGQAQRRASQPSNSVPTIRWS
jgi:hypothetical protein